MMAEDWTVDTYYARVRASQLKPTAIPTVYQDPSGNNWNVPDPRLKTPDERRAIFHALERNRMRQ